MLRRRRRRPSRPRPRRRRSRTPPTAAGHDRRIVDAAEASCRSSRQEGETKKDDKPPVHSKWDATLYGFAELDVINDSTQGFGELAGGSAIARPNTYAGDHGQTTYTTRNSRIGFKLAAPEANGIKASAQLEMDFLGNQPPGISDASLYQNPTFRIRHMNVKLETPVRRRPRGSVLAAVRLAVDVPPEHRRDPRRAGSGLFARTAGSRRQVDQG